MSHYTDKELVKLHGVLLDRRHTTSQILIKLYCALIDKSLCLGCPTIEFLIKVELCTTYEWQMAFNIFIISNYWTALWPDIHVCIQGLTDPEKISGLCRKWFHKSLHCIDRKVIKVCIALSSIEAAMRWNYSDILQKKIHSYGLRVANTLPYYKSCVIICGKLSLRY